MNKVTIISICILSSLSFAQIQIQYINNVSEDFKEGYYSQKREYNPLHEGNVWQYYYSDNNAFWTTKVVMDASNSLTSNAEIDKEIRGRYSLWSITENRI
ncbi:MAG: hypothetical protein KF721_01615 [Ignavibacteriaceae bacterium]|nr:hypothetical protein [Ignavibacteriaceae bacterium]